MYTVKLGDTVYLNKQMITKIVNQSSNIRRVDVKSGIVVQILQHSFIVEFKNKWRCYLSTHNCLPLNEVRKRKINTIYD